jgi:alpha-beta hydrolase superfamily lysophospholipase
MMERLGRATLAASMAAVAAACAGAPPAAPVVAAPAGAPVTAPSGPLAITCDDDAARVATRPESLAPWTEAARGDVVRCQRVEHLDAATLAARLAAKGYDGAPPKTGVTIVRIGYRARRDDAAKKPDAITGAFVLFPDAPRATDVAVLDAHGTIGLAAACAPTRSPTHPLNLALAGAGFVTVATEYQGFSYDEPPQAWMSGEDEARALFDSASALTKLTTEAYHPKKVLLIGHSEGGHTVLAAQALARADGFPIPIAGVISSAPMWFGGRLFADMIGAGDGSNHDAGSRDLVWSLFYFYGHGATFSGQAEAVAAFAPARRDEIAKLLSTKCALDLDAPLGKARAADVYDPAFVGALKACLGGGACTAEATRWVSWMKRDAPVVDPAGAPVLLWAGGADVNVTPTRARCAAEDLARTLPKGRLAVCVDPKATHKGAHEGLLERDVDRMIGWLSARAFGDPEPACDGIDALDALGKLTCPRAAMR